MVQERAYFYQHPLTDQEAKVLVKSAAENSDKIPLHIIIALIEVESKYDKHAESKVGCKGLTQLSPATAKKIAKLMGLKHYNLLKIKDNTDIGVYYLYLLLQENGSMGKALTIYNAGWKGYVKRNKMVSSYARLILKKSRVIKKLLKNDLFCRKSLTATKR